ncbi:hypothetical protein DLD77_05995 [Chitinophaga alhagiae]|uniref:Uncharacterized protein n=1 Tax=Chitinophaga alhagiae TaxID=2203219 RepID=A0ABM6WBB8_9BACT|nr:hypothetical protein [Chitinophaga alhagiae]AWO01273.1 hypothetical protein DLD77_05995 [Chitinophaga alhagiae]
MEDRYLQQTGAWLEQNAGIRLPAAMNMAELEAVLARHLEMLVERDFQQFVLLLYQVDVPERKVKEILASENYPDVFLSIARLIISRQTEKIKSREKYRQPPESLPDDEEKW